MAPNMNPFGYMNHMASADTEKYYLNVESADVFFVCSSEDGEMERIPAHEFILGKHPTLLLYSVFHQCFRSNGVDIQMNNVKPAAFKEFLKYFYMRNPTVAAEYKSDVKKLWQNYMIDQNNTNKSPINVLLDRILALDGNMKTIVPSNPSIPTTKPQTNFNIGHQMRTARTAAPLRLYDDQMSNFLYYQRYQNDLFTFFRRKFKSLIYFCFSSDFFPHWIDLPIR